MRQALLIVAILLSACSNVVTLYASTSSIGSEQFPVKGFGTAQRLFYGYGTMEVVVGETHYRGDWRVISGGTVGPELRSVIYIGTMSEKVNYRGAALLRSKHGQMLTCDFVYSKKPSRATGTCTDDKQIVYDMDIE